MLRRLSDWWTRPSWEDYLSEHQAAVDQHSRAIQALYKVATLESLIMTLEDHVAKLIRERDEQHDVADRLTTANAEAAHNINSLENRHQTVLDLNTKLMADNVRLFGENDELNKEVIRLRALLMDEASNSPIESVDIMGDGGVEVRIGAPHWAVRVLANSFLESLGDAKNYMALTLGPIPTDGGSVIVTVCRATGTSPTEMVHELKESLHELYMIAKTWGPTGVLGFESMVKAEALLNPKLKADQ